MRVNVAKIIRERKVHQLRRGILFRILYCSFCPLLSTWGGYFILKFYGIVAFVVIMFIFGASLLYWVQNLTRWISDSLDVARKIVSEEELVKQNKTGVHPYRKTPRGNPLETEFPVITNKSNHSVIRRVENGTRKDIGKETKK